MRECGFTYLGLLFLVALFGFGLASAGLVWHTVNVQHKEHELLFVGEQYRQAIASYYASGQRELPKSLDDLILDPRFPTVRRHLRRLYPDPFTGSAHWGLVKAGDRILGVYSLAPGKPLRTLAPAAPGAAGTAVAAYSDWKFVVDVGRPGEGPRADPRRNLPVAAGNGQGAGPSSLTGNLPQGDSCEQAQEEAIAACEGGDPSGNNDFQACVGAAMQQFQACRLATR